MSPPKTRPEGAAATAPASAVLMAVLAMLLWASGIVTGRFIHEIVPPFGLVFWRNVVAAAILLPFAAPRLRRDWPVIRRRWRILAVMAFAIWVVGSASLFLGLNYTTAVNAGIVNATQPVLIVIIAWILSRDTVTRRQAAGIAVSTAGVAALIARGDIAVLASLDVNAGDVLVLLAVLGWSVYVVLVKRVADEMHPLSFLTAVIVIGGMELAPFYLVEHALFRVTTPDPATVMTVLYLAVAATILAVMCWNRAILGLGHNRAGLFSHLMPTFSVVLAIIFLGESLRPYHLAGIGLIATGLYLTTVSGARRR